jgi:hypothetical protein
MESTWGGLACQCTRVHSCSLLALSSQDIVVRAVRTFVLFCFFCEAAIQNSFNKKNILAINFLSLLLLCRLRCKRAYDAPGACTYRESGSYIMSPHTNRRLDSAFGRRACTLFIIVIVVQYCGNQPIHRVSPHLCTIYTMGRVRSLRRSNRSSLPS